MTNLSDQITREDIENNGGPNMAHVLTLLDKITDLTTDDIDRLAKAFDQQDIGHWHTGADPGWRSAIAAGLVRQRGWYLARHAAESVASQRGGMPIGLGYLIGYVAAAVANHDLLTSRQFDALTGPWRTAVDALPGAK